MTLNKNSSLEEKLKEERIKAQERDAQRIAQKTNTPYLNLIEEKIPVSIKAIEIVKEEDAKKAYLVPFQIIKKNLKVALLNPQLEETKKLLEELKKIYEIQVFVVSIHNLEYLFSYYQFIQEEGKEISGRVEINEQSLNELKNQIKKLEDLTNLIENFKNPVTSEIIEIILAGAIATNASDIHIEPTKEQTTLRLRIDGILHIITEKINKSIYLSVINRIKLLSNLKLNINDQPQDGRFTIDLKDRDIEIRTSIIPSEYGETAVLRILDPLALKVNLEELGWREDDLKIVIKEIEKPNGLILNTGPTGSGKTTTLYAFLKKIISPEIKIITVEDPIEYHLEGVSQTQVDPEAGYTFASGLRSILRQDPDVILVGEIRDKETAEIALNASLTGHLVFSTLHTNDAIGAIPRLLDLDIPPQILGPALTLIIAQRLVRVLCPYCKTEQEINEEIKKEIEKFIENLPSRVNKEKLKNYKIFQAKGCEKCNFLGYKGRTSIFELFQITEKIEELIYQNPTEIQLKKLAREEGMVYLQEDGIIKVLLGITTFEEVKKITGPLPFKDL